MEKTKKAPAPKQEIKKDTWEMKDRTYLLKGNMKPLTYTLQGKSRKRVPLVYFDEEKGYNRELRYATNQRSPFVDEQDANVLLGHIVFEKGVLRVPKQDQVLQKLLSLYHPFKGSRYEEYSPVEEAKDDLEYLNIQVEAMNSARNMDIEIAEAIMRTELGSEVNTMSSKEIKRDVMVFANKNPELFLELANDENVQLRNFGIVAVENAIIDLSQDQRTFSWTSNGRKLMNVPFDENPYSALAAWFKTDEGVEVYKSIKKKLK
jgi:hypothetical protein|tara:strand:- start:8 stop:793 length:786 start_codon:yes stop_codon:yes gene_type:complete